MPLLQGRTIGVVKRAQVIACHSKSIRINHFEYRPELESEAERLFSFLLSMHCLLCGGLLLGLMTFPHFERVSAIVHNTWSNQLTSSFY